MVLKIKRLFRDKDLSISPRALFEDQVIFNFCGERFHFRSGPLNFFAIAFFFFDQPHDNTSIDQGKIAITFFTQSRKPKPRNTPIPI